jgi:DNA mismatch repair protein MSH4
MVLVPDTFFSPQDPALAGGVTGKRVKGGGSSTATSTSLLVEYVREEFPGVVVEPVGRKYWNDAGGL